MLKVAKIAGYKDVPAIFISEPSLPLQACMKEARS